MKFKPNINDIIKEYKMDPVLIVPKNGGLKDIVAKTLKDMGVDYLNFSKTDRDNYTDGCLKVAVYRGEDIPQVVEELYFEKRIKAIGFTGDDLFDEYILRTEGTILQILETIDWYDEKAKFRRPALCTIGKDKPLSGNVKVAVNKKYELTSKQALEELQEKTGIIPDIRLYAGNTEQAVAEDINDFCIETVYSGETAARNNLNILDKIRFSDFVLIGVNEANPAVFKREYNIIQDRVKNPVEGSYTSKLSSNANNALKKPIEEFIELMVELSKPNPDKKRIVSEFGDLSYAIQVNMAMRGISFEEIMKEQYKRLKRR